MYIVKLIIMFLVSVKRTDLFTTADFNKSISFLSMIKLLVEQNSAADHSLQYVQ